MSVLYWIIFGLMCATGMLWLLSVLQLVTRGRDMEFRVTADADPDAPTNGPLVSVIIPARNEEGNIGPCVKSVLAQSYQDFEVVVLNDRSEDGTQAEIETVADGDARVRTIMGKERPEGWMGKVWACNVAQEASKGEVLLFIDADVRLSPEAIRQSLAYMNRRELGALSVFGRLTTVTFWEKVVQPVVGGLILQNNDPREVNDPDKPEKIMANGQFIMARREAYDQIGGHAAIKGEILDDVSFARRCKEDRVPYHVVYGRQLFSCRMYSSLGEIWEGWTKNLFAGLDFRLWLTLMICVALFLINIMPFLIFAATAVMAATGVMAWSDPLLWVAGLNVVLTYIVYIGGLRVADMSTAYFWSFPLGMLVTIGLFGNSALRIASGKGVAWKGRTYTRTSERQKG